MLGFSQSSYSIRHYIFQTIFDTCRAGNVDALKHLLQQGTDINIRNSENETPLHVVAAWDQCEIIEELISQGADVNVRDKYGNTSLHTASLIGSCNAIKILLKHDFDINATNNAGATPLDQAVRGDEQDVVKLLIEKDGKQVNKYTFSQKLSGIKDVAYNCTINQIQTITSLNSVLLCDGTNLV